MRHVEDGHFVAVYNIDHVYHPFECTVCGRYLALLTDIKRNFLLCLTSHDRVPLAPEHESHIKLMSLYVAGGHGQEVAFSLAV